MPNAASGVDCGQGVIPPWLTNVIAMSSNGRHSLAVLAPPASPPRLTIRSQGKSLLVSWPREAAAWQLFSATNLLSPTQWAPWTSPLTTNQDSVSTPIDRSDSSRFFQLRSP